MPTGSDWKMAGAAQILKLKGVRLKLRNLECRNTTELWAFIFRLMPYQTEPSVFPLGKVQPFCSH